MRSMTVLLVFLIGCVIFLGGCAAVPMQHPTKVSMEQDKYECLLVAEQRSAAWGGNSGINPILLHDFMVECLERRGWRKIS